MICTGIDPGKDGAIVVVEREGSDRRPLAQLLTREIIMKTWEPRLIREALRSLPVPSRVVLELSAGRPMEGAGSARETGIGWGTMLACASLVWPGAEILVVSAAKWHKWLGDVQGDTPKARAISYVTSRLPDLDLTPGRRRVPHTGIADAGCLALYGVKS